MFYIKLEDDLSLVITQRDTLRRGDNLSKKVIYLIPKTVGELDTTTAIFYLSFVRADGIADIVTLERLDEMYNESYYQFTFPITCKLTRFAGSVCTWMQIYDGSMSNPQIAKSGECVLQVEDSRNMDDYFSDRIVMALYQHDKRMADKFAEVDENIAENSEAIADNATAIGENAEAIKENAEAIAQNAEAIGQNAEAISQNADAISQNATAIGQNSSAISQNIDAINALGNALNDTNANVAKNANDIAAAQTQIAKNADDIAALQAEVVTKADGLTYDPDTRELQLTASGTPIGTPVLVGSAEGKLIDALEINADGELVVTYSDGSSDILGTVVGTDGKVYVAHIDEHKILSWTVEDKEGDVPDPVDLNPSDDWQDIDDEVAGKTDYVWENL